MRPLDGTQCLVRIFVGENAPWERLLERLHREGFAGATVLRGIAGFGAASVIHTAHVLDLSADLPVVIEVVDDEEHVARLTAVLEETLAGGALVTLEKVRVLKYGPGGAERPSA